jgi:hypothetical protein
MSGKSIYMEKREILREKLEAIDRLDLKGMPETIEYFLSTEEPTCDGCIEKLLKIYPEKKIYEDIKRDDPYEN